MSIIVETPFQNFTGLDGKPLTNGKVYIGQVGTDPTVFANQIPVFWDEALTIPASQPLMTSSGYIVRTGTPARVYVATDYSMSVKNASNILVYYLPQFGVTDLSIFAKVADLIASTGSSLIGWIQAGAGAIYRTVRDKLLDTINVIDFGADITGASNSVDAFNAAILACANKGGGTVSATGIFKISGATSIYLPSNVTLNLTGSTLNGDGTGTNTLIKSGAVIGGVLVDITSEWGTGAQGAGTNFCLNARVIGGSFANAACGIRAHRFNYGSTIEHASFEPTLTNSYISSHSWGLKVEQNIVHTTAIMKDFVDWTTVTGNSFEGPSSANLTSAISIQASYGGSYSLNIFDNGFHHFTTGVELTCETTNLTIEHNHFENVKFHVSGNNLNDYNLKIQQNWMKANLEVPGACIAIALLNSKNSKLGPNYYSTDGSSTFDAYVVANTTDCFGNIVELEYSPSSVPDLTKYQLSGANKLIQLGGSNNPTLFQPTEENMSGTGAYTFEQYKHRYNAIPNKIPYCTVVYSGTTIEISTWIPSDASGIRNTAQFCFNIAGANSYIMSGRVVRLNIAYDLNVELFAGTAGLTMAVTNNAGAMKLTITGAPSGGNITGWIKQM